jgi:hypothetical protein
MIQNKKGKQVHIFFSSCLKQLLEIQMYPMNSPKAISIYYLYFHLQYSNWIFLLYYEQNLGLRQDK